MSNLTFDEGLLKEHPPEPLDGHAVVVFRRAGQAGEELHSILLPGMAPVKEGPWRALRNPAGYVAYAVDTSVERRLRFSERICLLDLSEFDMVFDLAYAASDVCALARARSTDPLRRVRDQVRAVIGREVEPLSRTPPRALARHARAMVDHCMEEVRELARGYGISIRSLQLTLHVSETMEAASAWDAAQPVSGLRRSGADRVLRLKDALEEATGWNGRRASPEPVCSFAEAADAPRGMARGEMDDGGCTPGRVLLGGSAPRQARPGDVILAQFAAYVAAFEARARQVLEREASPDEVRPGVETDCQWAVGARVSVRCRAPGLVVPTPVQSFVWNGECRAVSFDLEVPADDRPRRTVIVMEAFVHDDADAPDAVQVARLALTLEIGAGAPAPAPPQTVRAAAARTAFASYAAQDRLEVLGRISSIRRSAGLEVFIDVVCLRMGEQWELMLREHILACDRFLLFWSDHARDSPWVEWEWQQALDAKGDDALELHLLHHVSPEGIPEPLRRLHFNDVYLLARDAELYRREHALPPAA
ncbi:MAG TPA: toll/interleukin-1 receptor domain-containing protein [Longimicrobium sp.]|nr:toll/interleukin-1 receptor domain-containing protein [Longimicrobium sp.]